MQLDKISNWIQIGSSLLIVVGIVLVIVELRQSKQLAQTALLSESWAVGIQRLNTEMGENPISTITKACVGEESLTMEEAGVLSTKYLLHMLTIAREKDLDKTALFEKETWKRRADGNLPAIFRTKHGRAWWNEVRKRMIVLDSELVRYADDFLNKMGAVRKGCEPSMEAIANVAVSK